MTVTSAKWHLMLFCSTGSCKMKWSQYLCYFFQNMTQSLYKWPIACLWVSSRSYLYSIFGFEDTENKRLSIWQLCHYWWHRKLSEWQLTVPPVTDKVVKLTTFCFQWSCVQWCVIILNHVIKISGTGRYLFNWKVIIKFAFMLCIFHKVNMVVFPRQVIHIIMSRITVLKDMWRD